MRVATSAQMAAIDRETIARGLAGIELMERAGAAVAAAVRARLADLPVAAPSVLVLVGKGNNGGDGLVVARRLAAEGVPVTALFLAGDDELGPDAAANRDRLPATVRRLAPAAEERATALRGELSRTGLVVDAVFGTGITPPLRGDWPELFAAVNEAGRPCLAVDAPSGVDGDGGRVEPVAVRADWTVTIGLPKLGLLLPPGRDHVGELSVVDIGFPPEVCARHTDDLHWADRAELRALLPERPTDLHKYRAGSLLVIAGSRAFGGAAHLAGLGALRSGAGLVTVAAPRRLETALRVGLPEALIAPLAETDAGTIAPLEAAALADLLERRRAVALGPGLGADPDTDAWVRRALADLELPVVVDADGLGAFSRAGRPPACGGPAILTPHPGELKRLPDVDASALAERPRDLVRELAARWGAVLLLKGSPTLIAAPDGRVHVNGAGDDALAHGGSGDVLTGLLAGLLAQGVEPLAAAVLGAHLHGRAGRAAAAAGPGRRAVLVREIADALGPELRALEAGAP